jgi:hypothetical protein
LAKERNKGIKIRREEGKLSLYANMILYAEKTKDPTKRLLKQMNSI